MAVTMAQTLDKDTVKQANVIATLDADTTQTLLWATAGTNFASTPLYAVVTPILAAGGLSAWSVTVMSTTTLTIVKTTTAGSGNAGIQALITVFLIGATLKSGSAQLLKDLMDRYPAGTVPTLNQA